MIKNKKTIIMIMALLLLLFSAACSSTSTSTAQPTAEAEQQEETIDCTLVVPSWLVGKTFKSSTMSPIMGEATGPYYDIVTFSSDEILARSVLVADESIVQETSFKERIERNKENVTSFTQESTDNSYYIYCTSIKDGRQYEITMEITKVSDTQFAETSTVISDRGEAFSVTSLYKQI